MNKNSQVFSPCSSKFDSVKHSKPNKGLLNRDNGATHEVRLSTEED
jgi:hypothetical protein